VKGKTGRARVILSDRRPAVGREGSGRGRHQILRARRWNRALRMTRVGRSDRTLRSDAQDEGRLG
jgi:hypothetical protein